MNEADILEKERSVLGLLLEGVGASIPDSICQLIAGAPETFTDGRNGIVAAAIKRVMDSEKVVGFVEVSRQLGGTVDDQYLTDLMRCAFVPDAAEFYSKTLLDGYRNRSIKRTFEEGLEHLERFPEHARAVSATATRALQNCELICAGNDARRERLKSLEFDASKEPKPLRVIYSLAGVPISTPGNLAVIAAEAKAGKSAFFGALIASNLVPEGSTVDCLGIRAAPNPGLAVVHIDTEQAPDDHWYLVQRAMRRARVNALPPWLRSYCFTGHSATECRDLFKSALQEANERHGGLHAILLDGAADLVKDVNDPDESNAFIAELHGLAIKYDAPLLCVIHYNPGGTKTRGHLGSQLERKSETNLVIKKDGEVSEVFSTRQRRAPILQGKGPKFIWSDEAGMHVSHETEPTIPKQARDLQPYLDEVFIEGAGRSHSDLRSTLMRVMDISKATAERKITAALKCGIIRKAFGGIYTRGACE